MRKILGSPVAWAPAVAVVVLAFFYFLVNFGAAANPEGNTNGLPVAIVNADAGGELNGQPVDFGSRVLESAKTNSRIGDDVAWTTLSSRKEAMRGIARGEYYGALVVPEDYSESITRLFRASSSPGGEVPEPARIEILANPSAGPFPSTTVNEILTGAVRGASESTSGLITSELTSELSARDVQVPLEYAAVLGEPVVAEVVDAQPTGENSGRGLVPFYLTFTASILGFIGANALYGGVEGLAGTLARRPGRKPSKLTSFGAKAVVGLVLTLVLGTVETLVAFGIYEVHRESSVLYALLFLSLVAAVSLFAALVLLEAFGARAGVLIGSFLVISLGLATSGGTTPPESLPGFLRGLENVLPFGHATEGTRALLFYKGRLDAGLGEALWVLMAYLSGMLVLGGLIALVRERLAGQRHEGREVGGSEEGEPALVGDDERAEAR